MNIAADGTPLRQWAEVRPDGKVHGCFTFSDAQMLERMERGEQWVPFTAHLLTKGRKAAEQAMAAVIMAEVAAADEPVTPWGGGGIRTAA